MNPIPVRTMKFDVPPGDQYHPLYIAGNAQLSYQHSALGLYVTYLEPFFVKSLRRVMDQIRDEKLRDEVDRFGRQEAQHYQRHADFNKIVLAHGYPGLEERLEQVKRDIDAFRHKSDRFRIGFIEGFESYTTQMGLGLLRSGVYEHKRTNPAFGDLFKWHMLEEIEHRNVAFDVYQHLYGSYGHRVRMCWFSQHHMFSFLSDAMRIMSAADIARHGDRCRIRLKHRLLSSVVTTPMRAKSMLPWYTPHNYQVPTQVQALSAHYTLLAQHVR